MNIYLLNYNNYYNRICKKEDTLTDYLNYQVGDTIQGVNFNPNDGVNTELIVNTNQRANYLLAVEDNIINSRWFIIESTRLRNGQHRLMLRRDLIADNYNDIINAPCFIEKATVSNNDPAIYNKENMTFNQIKTSETELKDKTNCNWIVGYYSRYQNEDQTSQAQTISNLNGEFKYIALPDIEFNGTSSQLPFTDNEIVNGAPNNIIFRTRGPIVNYKEFTSVYCAVSQDLKGTVNANKLYTWDDSSLVMSNHIDGVTYGVQFSNALDALNINWTTLQDQLLNYINVSDDKIRTLLEWNGKLIHTTDNKYYKFYMTEIESTHKEVNIQSGNLFNTLSNITAKINENTNAWGTTQPNANTFKASYNSGSYQVRLYESPLYQTTGFYNIPQNRYHLNDAPYDMFCIPYGDNIKIYNTGNTAWGGGYKVFDKNIAMACAMGIASKYGNYSLYDLQLLPYCPMESIIVKPDGSIDLQNASQLYSTMTVSNTEDSKILGIIINCNVSSWNFIIPYNINISDFKLSNECDVYRLVSPNYNGQFEFSPSMNNNVEYFNVECTYLPFNPYINISPNFKNLYGTSYKDNRGLVCQGDFSLPIVTDQYKQAMMQNKNMQNIFNREVENMQVTHKYEMIQSGVQAIAGVAQGAVSGAALGGVGGAIVGGAASLAGGIADQVINQKLHNEALDYKQDLYNMQLGNIKAQPNSLAKTSAFNIDTRKFPILEYYTCTEKEKQALKNKIKYNGMTVGRIGTINEFLQPDYSYIKGKLIRLETIEDTNYLNEIASEIYKGVFIK